MNLLLIYTNFKQLVKN